VPETGARAPEFPFRFLKSLINFHDANFMRQRLARCCTAAYIRPVQRFAALLPFLGVSSL